MQDTLTQLLADFRPFEGDDAAADMLVRKTKYERLEGLFPVNLGNDISVVAVIVGVDKGALVMRTLDEQVPLSDGKTFNRYMIDGVAGPFTADECEARLREIRSAFEARVLHDSGLG